MPMTRCEVWKTNAHSQPGVKTRQRVNSFVRAIPGSTRGKDHVSESITKENNRILIVDDNQLIHEDFRKILCPGDRSELRGMEAALFGGPVTSQRTEYEIDSAQQGQEGLALVKKASEEGRPYSLAFVDVRMPPGWDGVETTSRIWQVCPDTQIVLCTAYSDYSWDDMIAKLNPADRLVILKKPFDPVEVLQLAAALTEKCRLALEARDRMGQMESKVEHHTKDLRKTNEDLQKQILERQKATEALLESEERYQLLFRENPLPMWVVDIKTLAFQAVNQAAIQGYGYTEEELLSMTLKDVHCPEDVPALLERFSERNARRSANGLITRHRKKDGAIITVEISSRVISFKGREAKLALANDITEKKKLEAQFLRAQRIEGIGTLASGMAHDLNNILAPILMSAGTLRWGLSPEEQEKAISRIELSVKRGAGIIQQVLTFGRGLNGERVALHAGEVIDEVVRIVGRTFPKDIVVSAQVEDGLWTVMGDRTQIHQVLLNLCVNARDAMPNGGKLMLHARNILLTETRPALPSPAPPGPYLLFQVSDTGCGISSKDRERIFDPFFTTKEIGKGTGLGLSTVLGIVKSHNGAVIVESEVGNGTTFQALLPASSEAVPGTAPYAPPDLPRGDGEAVLIVDDEPEIISGMRVMLEQQNYRVLVAKNGLEAMAVIERHGSAINAVVTDMMMPEMDGVELVRELRRKQPRLQIIASSGLGTEKGGSFRAEELQVLGVKTFLAKPYAADKLLGALHDLLRDGKGARATGTESPLRKN
jgi:two-component system, cell cycle sensor histidine kinase and response regulator CckA